MRFARSNIYEHLILCCYFFKKKKWLGGRSAIVFFKNKKFENEGIKLYFATLKHATRLKQLLCDGGGIIKPKLDDFSNKFFSETFAEAEFVFETFIRPNNLHKISQVQTLF